MKPKILAQGAEAKIILSSSQSNGEQFITKNRIKKSYRTPELDKKIRKHRTKAETKLLLKASKIINTPIPEDQKEFDKIKMPFIKGKKLSENLDNFPLEKQKQICKTLGKEISKLHNADIIHGDLTTSNMILVKEKKDLSKNSNSKKLNSQNQSHLNKSQRSIMTKFDAKQSIASNSEPKIYFIDFGLGYFNGKYEDKAVDLHLLKQALEAKHFKHWKELWKAVETGYKNQCKKYASYSGASVSGASNRVGGAKQTKNSARDENKLNFNNLKARAIQILPGGDAGYSGQLGKVKIQKERGDKKKQTKNNEAEKVLERLIAVEKRGRYKH